jgi:hypothetical protein
MAQSMPAPYAVTIRGDLIEPINRWGYRVAGYAALVTDEYLPFRLGE